MEEKQEQFLNKIKEDFYEIEHTLNINYTNLEYYFEIAKIFTKGIEYFINKGIELEKRLIEKALEYSDNLVKYFINTFELSKYNIDDISIDWNSQLPNIIQEFLSDMEN